MGRGAVVVPEVKVSDLCRPKGVDRNDVRALRARFAAFARQASSELSTMLRRASTLAVTGDRESTWLELVDAMDRQPFLATFSVAGETAVLALARDTAIRLLELRLGGGQRPLYREYTRLTDCDYSVVGTITGALVAAIGASLGSGRKLVASLARQLTDAPVRDLVPQSEMFLVCSFELTLGNDPPVAMLVGLPVGLVQQLSESLRAAEDEELLDDPATSAAGTVLTVPLDVVLELPAIELTPATVAGLDVGDVIRLHHPLTRPLDLKADGVRVARARIGRARSRLACVVVDDALSES